MKQFLFSLLILIMLAPALACAAHPVGHEGDASADHAHFVHDCAGFDFLSADGVPAVKVSDAGKGFPDGILPGVVPDVPRALAEILRPPPDWPEPLQTYPSHFLTTQRLLI
jgi:hypothetical protein